MANLCTKIEIYLGRTPDFSNEVQVFGDGGVQTINLWNCTDKPEPKESDLCSDEEADYFDGMRFLRQDRNIKLKESDWMANSDVTMSDAWKTYRQALRDITKDLKTSTQVKNVTWPTEPS
jgi:hypothetical protein